MNVFTAILLILLVLGAISLAIAHFLGKKRQVGFEWSFFFCFFLSPITGFIVIMLSPKYYEKNPAPSNSKKIWGWILIVFFSLALLGNLIGLLTRGTFSLFSIFMYIGFIGLGYYLIELSKGKNFNNQALTKTDN